MLMNVRLGTVLCALALGLCSFVAQAQQSLSEDVRKAQYNLKKGLAIDGYDPVAYFTREKAMKGSPDVSYVYKGVEYRFVTVGNRDLFKADPGKYEPEYGGWCAYAMGDDGTKYSINPETFKIVDGKLYLFTINLESIPSKNGMPMRQNTCRQRTKTGPDSWSGNEASSCAQ